MFSVKRTFFCFSDDVRNEIDTLFYHRCLFPSCINGWETNKMKRKFKFIDLSLWQTIIFCTTSLHNYNYVNVWEPEKLPEISYHERIDVSRERSKLRGEGKEKMFSVTTTSQNGKEMFSSCRSEYYWAVSKQKSVSPISFRKDQSLQSFTDDLRRSSETPILQKEYSERFLRFLCPVSCIFLVSWYLEIIKK